MFESIFSTAAETTFTIQGLLLSLGTSFLLGLLISFIYVKSGKEKSNSQNFALTLVMLPAVITVIILLVGSNVARAFSLAGAFSIIRFRSAPGSPKDIAYVLLTMAVGLSCGMGYIFYAAVVAIILCAVMFVLEAINFGQATATAKTLKITIPENLDYQHIFDDLLGKYTTFSNLQKVKTSNLGSLFELEYQIGTRDNIDEKEFIDELRTRNGNLNITLVMAQRNGEY